MTVETLNIVDGAVLTLVFLSGVIAALRGFTHSMLTIGVWVGAFLATRYGYAPARDLLAPLTGQAAWTGLAAGIGLFLLSLLLLSVLRHQAVGWVRASPAGSLDRALGFLFGVARGVLLVCLLWIGASLIWPWRDMPDAVRSARATPWVQVLSTQIIGLLPESLGHALRTPNLALRVSPPGGKAGNGGPPAAEAAPRPSEPSPAPPSEAPYDKRALERLIEDSI